MSYFRYTRQAVVATEVDLYPWGVADVMADTKSEVYEVEVKVSLADLKKEFECKVKHRGCLKNESYLKDGYTYNIPINYFYFCVPVSLLMKADKYLHDKNDKFGIMAFDPDRTYYDTPEKFIFVEKRAKKLTENYNTKIRDKIIARMSSDLCQMYERQVGMVDRYHPDQLFFTED
jgi:hypothetical protein